MYLPDAILLLDSRIMEGFLRRCGKAAVTPDRQEILFEQRNARKDTKKFHGSGFVCENKSYFP
jgi:hypothetical protein